MSAKRPKGCRRNVQNVSSQRPTRVGETSVDLWFVVETSVLRGFLVYLFVSEMTLSNMSLNAASYSLSAKRTCDIPRSSILVKRQSTGALLYLLTLLTDNRVTAIGYFYIYKILPFHRLLLE